MNGTGIFFAGVMAGAIIVAAAAGFWSAFAKPIESDVQALCTPYGGVREISSKTYTVRRGAEETWVSVYCKDGSYVSRSTTGKP